MDLMQELAAYRPWNEQEERDRAELLRRLGSGEELYSRDNVSAHFTASAWVVNPGRDKVLMAYHNIYRSWAWTGGHADGEEDLCAVARREVEEETGLQGLLLLCSEPIALDVLPVPPHQKRGKPVASHLHLNLTYLFEGDDALPLRIKEDENSRVGWLPAGELSRYVSEEAMLSVYQKMMDRAGEYPPALSGK